MSDVITTYLFKDRTTTGAGTSVTVPYSKKSFQCKGSTTSGTGSVVVDIEFSNDGIDYLVGGTFSLTLSTTTVSEGFIFDARWLHYRANVKSISGTGASVTVIMVV